MTADESEFQIGGFCPRGGGHVWWTHDEDYDGSCGSKSWPIVIKVNADEADEVIEALGDAWVTP